ncbi:ester cyclase [Blastococcus sp. SYSU D00669]
MDPKDVVRRFVEECVNTHRAELLDRFVHESVTMHPGTPGEAAATEGIDELRQAYRRFRVLFPDLHVIHELLIAEGPYVAARWTATGTAQGSLGGVEPSGEQLRWGGTDVYRVEDGRIVEWWRNDDFAGLLRRLGRRVVPTAD